MLVFFREYVLRVLFINNLIVFLCIGIPSYDGVPNETIDTVDLSVACLFCVLASAGIVFACVCLVFNFSFRKEK